MRIQFRSFYNIDGYPYPNPIIYEMRKYCTNCKHMLFQVGNSDSKKIEDREIYCGNYPGSHVPITSSEMCRFFKLQLKYKLL
jgi:hypothetical protein